ncbi:MAG: citramalate synthase [Proteobacteria bacterium]|nr:citramalate synthase [Pseudomonadota bacterium]MBU1610368.1 citramalate synthase [Pseudomonadota bacterium]
MRKVEIYDTTLRDGTQAEELNLTTEDKLLIAHRLDDLGLHYIEGGWPGSNPTDKHFFAELVSHSFKNAKIAAFGSTHHPGNTAEKDANLRALVDAATEVVTIFGKSWDLHAKIALKISLERNIELIRDSIAFLKSKVPTVFYDGEHFFDGYKADPQFALACARAAAEAGADCIIPCDTNGGSLPREIAEIMRAVKQALPDVALGIHTHNDSELAVAGALAAVDEGASQVQGTINGFGERCGNANLCSIIPNLELKLGVETIGSDNLQKLTRTASYVTEVANLRPFLRQPFVGSAAFAHKGGIHVSAVMKDSRTYEHIPPASVGNEQRVLLSDQAGKSNIIFKAQSLGYVLKKNDPRLPGLLACIKEREAIGFEYSVAEASFELMLHELLGSPKEFFSFKNFFVVDSKREQDNEPITEATVIVEVKGNEEHTAACGNGPVNALDLALRKGLQTFYPRISEVRLKDFKVRVVAGAQRDTGGTASYVRVLIESSDGAHRWTTVGVSHNIIEASWQAVVDSYNYKLLLDDNSLRP